MKDISEAYNASLVKSQFKAYKDNVPINNILVSYDDKEHTFELYLNKENKDLEKLIKNHFSEYRYKQSKEYSEKRGFYYQITFKGLFHNLK